MTDITNIILNGDIEGLADYNCAFKKPKSDKPFVFVKTGMMERGTAKVEEAIAMTTLKTELIEVKWGDSLGCQYTNVNRPLTYYLHTNPYKAGVNILEIPLDGQNGDITFPCFVSSGELSGCVYAWFLLAGKIVFLHAGADAGNSVENENKEERRCKERADIFNGLRYCIVAGDYKKFEKEPVTVYLSTEELLKKIQGLVKAGQIIYPADDEEKEDMGMIQTMSYRPQTGPTVGECLCIITKSEEGIKISGMITEKEGGTYKNHQGRILKVNELGNEIR